MVIDLRVDFSNNNEADDCFTLTLYESWESHKFFFSPMRRRRRRRHRRSCSCGPRCAYINLKIRWHFAFILKTIRNNIIYRTRRHRTGKKIIECAACGGFLYLNPVCIDNIQLGASFCVYESYMYRYMTYS